MQPQKVIIGHSWIDEGVNIQTKQVAFCLSKEARVWYLTQSRVRNALPHNPNLTVLEWPNKRPTKRIDFAFAIRQVRKIKPDLLIVHFASTKALLFAGWLFGVRYRIAWYHTLAEQARLEAGGRLKAMFDLTVRTATYRMATHVITFTPFAAHDAIHGQHIHPIKIRIVPNGIQPPIARQASYDYTAKQVVFLYVGRITYSKGCDLLVNVFSKLTKAYSNISLCFIGKGDTEEGLRSLIRANRLESQLTLKGATTSYTEVFEHMVQSYALLVPSRVDNYPTVILEAMACGLPVIGADTGGIPYMIENGLDGFICSGEQDWVEKCELMINDIALRNQMAANARDSFEKKYTMERHVSKVMQLIHSLP